MKTTTLALMTVAFLLALAGGAFGQSVLSNQPQVFQIPDHPMHAEIQSMACEHPLVGGGPNTYTYAQGERPLWEFGPVSEPTPLGDVARAFRQQKLAARKAQVILEK